MTFNKSLLNILWHIYHIGIQLKDAFCEKQIIAYWWNRNLEDIIGSTAVMNNHVARKPWKQLLESSYQTCFTQTDNLCCMQLIAAKTFKNNVRNYLHKILNNITSKNTCLIHLLHCTLCKPIYFGWCETFNICWNNHRRNLKRTGGKPALKYY